MQSASDDQTTSAGSTSQAANEAVFQVAKKANEAHISEQPMALDQQQPEIVTAAEMLNDHNRTSSSQESKLPEEPTILMHGLGTHKTCADGSPISNHTGLVENSRLADQHSSKLSPPLRCYEFKNPRRQNKLRAFPTGQWTETRQPYKAGWLRQQQVLTPSCWERVKTVFRTEKHNTCVLTMPFEKVVKFGKRVHISEAWALKLVAEKTTIPVPKVYSAFKKDGNVYIVMKRIKGKTLGEAWDEMTREDKNDVLEEMKGYFEQLRQIPHPRPRTNCTAAADNHPIFAHRTPWNEGKGAGPFENEHDFNLFLRSGNGQGAQKDLETLVEFQDRVHHEICFTRGDASLWNIMVEKLEGKYHVTGLIDFEMSGFLPEYWK